MSGAAIRSDVAGSLARSPIIGVIRTDSQVEAAHQAELFLQGGIELLEVTYTVPDATDLVRRLLAQRTEERPAWIGMGTVTNTDRAEAAISAGAEFIVSPNASADVAAVAQRYDRYLVMGALTPTEIVKADALGADLVKVYPLPPVGGPAFLSTVRQPLGDIPMLAGGGFDPEEIPLYRTAGAVAFGIGSPLLAEDDPASIAKIARALDLARGKEPL